MARALGQLPILDEALAAGQIRTPRFGPSPGSRRPRRRGAWSRWRAVRPGLSLNASAVAIAGCAVSSCEPAGGRGRGTGTGRACRRFRGSAGRRSAPGGSGGCGPGALDGGQRRLETGSGHLPAAASNAWAGRCVAIHGRVQPQRTSRGTHRVTGEARCVGTRGGGRGLTTRTYPSGMGRGSVPHCDPPLREPAGSGCSLGRLPGGRDSALRRGVPSGVLRWGPGAGHHDESTDGRGLRGGGRARYRQAESRHSRRAPAGIVAAGCWMSLPRMHESSLHPRSPCPSLGERWRDLAAEPGLAVLVPPPARARGWLSCTPRSGIRRGRVVRPPGPLHPKRSIPRARGRPDTEPGRPR